MLLLSILHSSAVCSAEGWALHKNKSGIKIYQKKHSTGLVEIKAKMELKSNINDFRALLEDTKNAYKWLDNVVSVKVLKRLSETENLVYSEFEAPWPVNNRDMFIHSKYQYNADGSLVIKMKTAEPNLIKGFKKNKENVLITEVIAHWQLTPLTPQRLEIIYIAYANPGGVLPNWLINQVALSGAYNTFEKLRLQLRPKS
ncbi:START domain-containing protein [Pseudoalteromonas denitrificans DSM 6059]|uniref:START domain-containing protein n=1 Tax=Pseudoalteromonas denitrificans DSM 6059 TaxID=1123010 RepID=A0A1I1J7S4_9GAMM|nr:START domain-containing protein [Pseudoalteromonas denitrificans DSM 6059]